MIFFNVPVMSRKKEMVELGENLDCNRIADRFDVVCKFCTLIRHFIYLAEAEIFKKRTDLP
jgi:hypothetical protein